MSLSVWIYGPGLGWWLREHGYDNVKDATAALAAMLEHGPDDWTGGAVVPDGEFPMPLCDACLKSGRLHHPATKKPAAKKTGK